jgi:hypothetical protein
MNVFALRPEYQPFVQQQLSNLTGVSSTVPCAGRYESSLAQRSMHRGIHLEGAVSIGELQVVLLWAKLGLTPMAVAQLFAQVKCKIVRCANSRS